MRAQVDPSDLAVASDGSLLLGECVTDTADPLRTYGRVRRIAPAGTITTAAGGPRHEPRGDGGPAVSAALGCPSGVAALPGGGFVIADGGASLVRRVSEVRSDGLASVLAGTGAERARRDDGRPAVAANVCPSAILAQPDGGFLVADQGFSRLTGEESRLRRVAADGRISTLVGTGRFVPNPPRGLERRGDGESARRADLRPITDIALTADGGVLIAEGIEDSVPVEGLIRYLAPHAPGHLATAIARDTDRWFTPGEPAAITVTSTAPATITLTLAKRTVITDVPAGRTRIRLGTLPRNRPYAITLSATDHLGRVAADRADLLPRGWLADAVARYAVQRTVVRATLWPAHSGEPISRCRRFSPARVDCALNQDGRSRCQAVVSMRLGAAGACAGAPTTARCAPIQIGNAESAFSACAIRRVRVLIQAASGSTGSSATRACSRGDRQSPAQRLSRSLLRGGAPSVGKRGFLGHALVTRSFGRRSNG